RKRRVEARACREIRRTEANDPRAHESPPAGRFVRDIVDGPRVAEDFPYLSQFRRPILAAPLGGVEMAAPMARYVVAFEPGRPDFAQPPRDVLFRRREADIGG